MAAGIGCRETLTERFRINELTVDGNIGAIHHFSTFFVC